MLSDKQRAAIVLIVEGRSFTAIEKEVGVSHSQLWEWRRNPEFVAELEQERAALHELRRDRLWMVTDRAMDVVLDDLDEGDAKMAIDIIRLAAAGLTDVRYVPAPAGRNDPSVPAPETSATLPDVHPELPASAGLYPCGTCGKQFKTGGALGSHRRSHPQG